jgi:hypothetical protein
VARQPTAALRDAARDLTTQREVFTPYGRMLVDEVCDWARTLDFGQDARAIPSKRHGGYVSQLDGGPGVPSEGQGGILRSLPLHGGALSCSAPRRRPPT